VIRKRKSAEGWKQVSPPTCSTTTVATPSRITIDMAICRRVQFGGTSRFVVVATDVTEGDVLSLLDERSASAKAMTSSAATPPTTTQVSRVRNLLRCAPLARESFLPEPPFRKRSGSLMDAEVPASAKAAHQDLVAGFESLIAATDMQLHAVPHPWSRHRMHCRERDQRARRKHVEVEAPQGSGGCVLWKNGSAQPRDRSLAGDLAVLALLAALPAKRLAPAVLAELFGRRRGLERAAEVLVRWATKA
jgi:hypothetical protein